LHNRRLIARPGHVRHGSSLSLALITSSRFFASLIGLLWHDTIGSMAKARYHYNIMLRPEPEGGYTALVPALPGCVTYGRTVDEAREMAKDAISGYIASLRKHKDPISTDL
jgi:predicted RNase H-like HicB family nuclease